MMVFFMFFGAANVARTILTEDRDGTMPRLFTTPTRHGMIIGGKFVVVFVTVLVQAVVLLIAGRLIFGIDWGRLDAVILLTLVAAGVAGGLALLVISFAKTPAQAGAIGSGVYLVLALLGGNFTGTAQTSGTYAVVQKFTPNGWLIEGWDTTMRGGGAGGHPLAGAGAAGVRRRLLLLRRAQDEEAVRVKFAAILARKDLLETVRDKLSFIFILVMPLAFTLFFGLLFGGGSDTDKLPLAVWDADGGAAAKQLVADLDKSSVVRVVVKQGERVRDVDGGRARRRRPPHPGGLQRRGGLRRAGRPHDRRHPGLQRRLDGRQRGALARRGAGDRRAGLAGRRGGRLADAEHAGRRRRRPRRPVRRGGAAGRGRRRSGSAGRRAPRSSRPAPPPARRRAASSSARPA